MNLFAEIKELVTARDAAEYYGFEVNRSGMICCPFHDDKHPSMKVDRNFHCFGCQENGDVIRFTEKLFNLSSREAAEKLISDFRLPIEVGRQPKKKKKRYSEYKRIRRQKMKDLLFEKSVDRMNIVYLQYFHLLNNWLWKYEPKSPDEDYHPLFLEAIHKKDYIEYLLDLLNSGTKEEKASIIIEKGREVIALEERIRKIRSCDGE
ncbi:MAG: DNA primase [Clostridiales bacterium]|nr:DNA primase [Clostridiales bacterium]